MAKNKIKWSQGARDVRDAAGIGTVAGMAMAADPQSVVPAAIAGGVLAGGAQLGAVITKAVRARHRALRSEQFDK